MTEDEQILQLKKSIFLIRFSNADPDPATQINADPVTFMKLVPAFR
jgi:hypothetical protein